MAEYKGSASEGNRAALLEKERQVMLDQLKKQKDQIAKDKAVNVGADKFVAQNDWVDSELKRQTVGLVKLEDFQRIRSNLEELRRKEDFDAAKYKSDDASNIKKIKKRKSKVVLSFDLDNEDEDVVVQDEVFTKKPKKNPYVETGFLPDKEREEKMRREREALENEWNEQQEQIKNEKIVITYSYWDGSGHRKQVECLKGDTIRQFLEKCRAQWPQLRSINVDNLVYVKEDLIIPSHYTFYDFIVNKTRGKSGPLFSFDVHDDIRLVNDARIETEESHAGKVCERSWIEANKHIFPVNRWEVFDPNKDFGKYSIK